MLAGLITLSSIWLITNWLLREQLAPGLLAGLACLLAGLLACWLAGLAWLAMESVRVGWLQ